MNQCKGGFTISISLQALRQVGQTTESNVNLKTCYTQISKVHI